MVAFDEEHTSGAAISLRYRNGESANPAAERVLGR